MGQLTKAIACTILVSDISIFMKFIFSNNRNFRRPTSLEVWQKKKKNAKCENIENNRAVYQDLFH